MAFEREPLNTERWERIISCNDGKEQGRLIKEYICELEDGIYNLQQQLEEERIKNRYDIIDNIMNLPDFRKWLSKHDSNLNKNYSGIQEGF